MRLGAHMSVSGGKYMALINGKKIGCESIQIFTRNIRSWISKPLDKKDIEEFSAKRLELKGEIYPVISHNSYLVNLGGTDKEKLEKSYNAMLDELIKAEQLGIEYVNMHPGNKSEGDTEDEALARIAEQINNLLMKKETSKVILLLETTAGQGNDLGYKFEHFRDIIEKVKNKERIGICFDTAHSFAAGYDYLTLDKYNKMWDEFDKTIGLKYLKAFHLNDSEKELGSRVDRHAHIGKGKIGKVPFGFFINDDRFEQLPGILETPEADEKYEMNLKVLKSLRKRKKE